MSNPIELFNPDGTVALYRKLSERLPKFLAAYPSGQGYRVVIEATDALAMRPGLVRLYEAAIQSGRHPAEAGLPALAETTVMCFQARLIGPEGQILGTASALKPIQSYKDWEMGETAARQRLVAALGFGGEVLDADEGEDFEAQGLNGVPQAPSPVPEREDQLPAQAPAASPPPAPPRRESGTIPASVLRQIEHQAKLKGVPVPVVGNLDEAKAALKRLFALKGSTLA